MPNTGAYSRTSTTSPSTTEQGLAIFTGTGWLRFFHLGPLECTCLYLCRESRRQVLRKVRVKKETPHTLWRRAADPSASGGGGDSARMEEFDLPSGGTGVTIGEKRAGEEMARFATRGRGGVRASPASMARNSAPTAATASRVTPVSVADVDWALPATELIAPGFLWPNGVKKLRFWAKFDDPLDRVDFPETLEVLSFGFGFNRSLEPGCVRWPPGLKRLTFGAKWNRRLLGARESWPASLKVLSFGSCFDKPLAGEGVGFPQGLREISLGGMFDQPLVGVDWPPLLRKLTLSDMFSQSLEGVVFPSGLREIDVRGEFNEKIDGVAWPEGLKILRLGARFNQALVGLGGMRGTSPLGHRHALPAGLKELYLGDAFNQPLRASELPDGLEVLVLGKSFAHVPSVVWPSALIRLHLLSTWGIRRRDARVSSALAAAAPIELPRKLEFLEVGETFNSSLTTVVWPPKLKILLLGSLFNRPIGRRAGGAELLPDGLVELRLGADFNQELQNVRLPAGLKRLIMCDSSKFNKPLAGVSWPPGLEELKLGNLFNQPLEGSKFPETLRALEFGYMFAHSLQGVALPDALTRLAFNDSYPASHVRGLDWPRSLRALYLGSRRFSSRKFLVNSVVNTPSVRLARAAVVGC